jgi:hypothetical protein
MKRLKLFVTALASASLVAAGVAAGAGATAGPPASCVGQSGSAAAATFHEGVGDVTSAFAHTGTLGATISAIAPTKTNCP